MRWCRVHTYPRAFYIPKRFPRARRDCKVAYNTLSPTFNPEKNSSSIDTIFFLIIIATKIWIYLIIFLHESYAIYLM